MYNALLLKGAATLGRRLTDASSPPTHSSPQLLCQRCAQLDLGNLLHTVTLFTDTLDRSSPAIDAARNSVQTQLGITRNAWDEFESATRHVTSWGSWLASWLWSAPDLAFLLADLEAAALILEQRFQLLLALVAAE